MSEPIKKGDTIKVNYTGRFENGDVFDSSEGHEPLKFTVGSGQLIRGFEEAVIGMSVGETQTVTIEPEKGYGVRNDELIVDLPKTAVPEEMAIEPGMHVELMDQDGNPVPAQIAEILDDVVKMDINHPLAGKNLVFDIELVETGLEPEPAGAGCQCGTDDSGCGSGGCGCGC
jgi:peptidylprolyl isomerase